MPTVLLRLPSESRVLGERREDEEAEDEEVDKEEEEEDDDEEGFEGRTEDDNNDREASGREGRDTVVLGIVELGAERGVTAEREETGEEEDVEEEICWCNCRDLVITGRGKESGERFSVLRKLRALGRRRPEDEEEPDPADGGREELGIPADGEATAVEEKEGRYEEGETAEGEGMTPPGVAEDRDERFFIERDKEAKDLFVRLFRLCSAGLLLKCSLSGRPVFAGCC